MRTRFPPSPTGFLHIGSLRTVLYSYLLAKQSSGTFILRIEDTDQERSVEDAVENIVRTLHWAGMEPDEGVMLENDQIVQKGNKGPYIQSERLDIYKEYAQKLLDAGQAYYAFDTKEELERMREEQAAAGIAAPKYDARVRMNMRNSLTLSPEESDELKSKGDNCVIRLKVPETDVFEFNDEIRGKVTVRGYDVDDTVLLKSDGFPTYHLAHVVDDHLMEIDLVTRGEEWLPSFPKHLLLFRAFGWEPPQYAHFPLLLNKDKSKLSKRQGDVAVEDYVEKGYLKEALLNFLASLGWNSGDEKEIYSMDDLIKEFSLNRVQKAGAVFDVEKLDWLQGQWIRSLPADEFAERIQDDVIAKHPAAADDADFEKKAALIQERITFFAEAPEMLSYYYSEPAVNVDLIASQKQKITPDMVPQIVDILIETLSEVDESDWTEEHLHEILFALADEKEMKRGQILWPLRAILTGLPYSPGAFEVAAVLGKEVTMKRLNNCKNM